MEQSKLSFRFFNGSKMIYSSDYEKLGKLALIKFFKDSIGYEVQLGSGEYDKTPNEIFQGDILVTHGVDGRQLWLCKIEMRNGVKGFCFICLTGNFSPIHNEVWENGVIIGNNLRNSELLTGE